MVLLETKLGGAKPVDSRGTPETFTRPGGQGIPWESNAQYSLESEMMAWILRSF